MAGDGGPAVGSAEVTTPMAGLVLCGGRSSRMGRDKATISVGGVPLVVRVIERLAQAADPILLAPGRPGRLGHLGPREVEDEVEGGGPLAGLVAGLEASPHQLLAVTAVDMPFANANVLALLAGLHAGEDAVVPITDVGLQPLHAVYARGALPALRESLQAGRLAVREVLDSLRVRVVPRSEWGLADPSGRFALNLNLPSDLALIS